MATAGEIGNPTLHDASELAHLLATDLERGLSTQEAAYLGRRWCGHAEIP